MGDNTLLIFAIAEEARWRAARPTVFCDPRGWVSPNGLVLCAADVPPERSITNGKVVWYPARAPSRARGYSVALGISRALLMRREPRPALGDIVRLATEILVHGPTLARIGERAYSVHAVHVPRHVVQAALARSVAA